MAIYNGPPRGGTRGGKDQFNWEDVKEDKQGQNYLGHSVKATKGRWQNGRDLTWYAKGSNGKAADLRQAAKDELAAAKARDMDLMAQMLGDKVMEAPKSKLQRAEKTKLFKKGDAEEGTVAESLASDSFGERVQGLGFAPVKVDDLREQMDVAMSEKIEGTGINVNELLAQHAAGDGDHHDHGRGHGGADHAAMLAAITGGGGFGGDEEGGEESKEDRKTRKAEKKAKKEAKKAKKEAKKASKGERKQSKKDGRRHDSESSESPEPRRSGAGSYFAKEGGGEMRGFERGEERSGSRERGGREGAGAMESRGRDRAWSRDRDRGMVWDRSDPRDRDRSRERERERERERRGRGRD